MAESRKWCEATSKLLSSMSREERMAYLSTARARYLAESEVLATQQESCVVREESPKK